jgi:hypothetical protein
LFGAVETVICASVTGNCSGCVISVVKEGANSVSVKTMGSNGQIPHFLKPLTAVDIDDAGIKIFPKILAT